MYQYETHTDETGAWFVPSDPDVMPTYRYDGHRSLLARYAATAVMGDSLAPSAEAVWDHVHGLPDAKDRVTLDQRGLPRHVHGWEPVDRVMTCDCGATYRYGLVVHPPVLVPVKETP